MILGLLLCVLVAQAYASAHMHGLLPAAASGKRLPLQSSHGPAGLDCHGCVAGAWSAPAAAPHLEGLAPGSRLETRPRPTASSQHDFRLTAPRAPPLV